MSGCTSSSCVSPTPTDSWGAAYEAWVSRAAGLPEDGWRRKSWVEAYRRVSALIQAREGQGRSTGSLGGDEEGAWVRALVFGQRAYLCGRRLGIGDAERPIVDLGSGTGGAGLAALENGCPEVLVHEMSELDAEIGRRVHGARGSGGWSRRTSLDGCEDRDWVWSFSWGEIDWGTRWLQRWLTRSGEGSWWIIEPGTQRSAQGLAKTRDEFWSHVRSPCPSTDRCPRREGRHWCHFTWNVPFGPMASWILDACGRETRRVLCSFVELGRERAPSRHGSRLLQLQKGKVDRLDLCGPEGEWRAEVRRKDRPSQQLLSGRKDGYDWVETLGNWQSVKPGLWRPGREGALVSRGTL